MMRRRKEVLKPLLVEVQNKRQLLDQWVQLSMHFSAEAAAWLNLTKGSYLPRIFSL